MRAHYNISAEEYWSRLPVWEIDLLLGALAPPEGDPEPEPVEDWSSPPARVMDVFKDTPMQ